MTSLSVCAVIVTYHPGLDALQNLSEILRQVQALVVVDNGSNLHEVHSLRFASQAQDFHLIENSENLGVAEALNQGVRWAQSERYPWVILFDQDSKITEGFIGQMFEAWKSHPSRERVGSIHCRHLAPKTGIEVWAPRTSDGSPVLPMTSGSLMPAWIFDKVGWFASEYFIDLVDWEYSFRVRKAGFLVVDSKQATLLHAPGNPAETTILGHAFHSTHHSAMRRYYLTRNRIVFYRKYIRSFPRGIASGAYAHLKETIVCLLIEKQRGRKFRNVLLGTWDALTGRMGKREDL